VAFILGVGAAVVGLDRFDSAAKAAAVGELREPGTAFDVVAGEGIDPGEVQDVPPAEVETLDPGEDVEPPGCSPAGEVGLRDAAGKSVD
jgi:hypothetical protein